jgi:hypothetical protein
MKPGLKELGRRLAIALRFTIATLATACGGGGSPYDDSFLLWVPTDAVVTDIDGDGRADLLTLAMSSTGSRVRTGHLFVRRQTAPGVFALAEETAFGQYPWRMAVGDVDGDGLLDVVVSDGDAQKVWLLMHDATRPGRFLAPSAFFSGGHFEAAVIADLNHDGAPDIAAVGVGSVVAIRYQDPHARGTFGPEIDVPIPGAAGAIAAGDIDGDGLVDLLTWSYTNPDSSYVPSGGFVVLFQRDDGGFDNSGLLATSTGLNNERLSITDANADGRLDLFGFMTGCCTGYQTQVMVVPQISARVFGTPTWTMVSGSPPMYDAVLADLNQDTVPDVALAGFSQQTDRMNLMLNNGKAAFVQAFASDLPIAASRLAVGDLDGDGRADIVLYGANNKTVVMYQSATPGVFLPPRPL